MNTFIKLFVFFIFLFVSLFFTILQINKTSYQPTSITIDIASGQKDMYQVFYDTGFGYNEKESLIFKTSGYVNQKAVFVIQGAKFKRFRIDPGCKKGVIKIKQICVENTISRKCWLNHDLLSEFKFINCINNQHLEDGSLVIESTGIDPYFECRDNLKGEINFNLNLSKALAYIFALLLINILVSAILFYSDRIYNKIRRVIDSTSTNKLYKPQKIFLFISIIWGVLTIFVIPPFQVPDEPNHFLRAYQIADGNFIPKTLNNQVGGFIPINIIELCKCYNSIHFHPEQKIKSGKNIQFLKNTIES